MRKLVSRFVSKVESNIEVVVGLAACLIQLGCAWGLNRLWPGHPVLDLLGLFVSGGVCCAVAWNIWNWRIGGMGDQNIGEGIIHFIAILFYLGASLFLIVFAAGLAHDNTHPADFTIFLLGACILVSLTAFVAGSLADHDETADFMEEDDALFAKLKAEPGQPKQ